MNLIRTGVMLIAAIGIAEPQTPPKFEVASIRPCKDGGDPGSRKRSGNDRSSPGNLYLGCETLEALIQFAYLGYENGKPWLATGLPGLPAPPISIRLLFEPIKGSPSWVSSEQYAIEAKAALPQSTEMMRGPMMQALLEDRFKLRIHRETRDVPVYLLTVAQGGPKLQTTRAGSCMPMDSGPPNRQACGFFGASPTGDRIDTYGQTTAGLCSQFSAWLDRDVIDKTALTGAFDIHLDLSTDLFSNHPQGDPATPADRFGELSSALRKLGLKLESAKAPGEFLVIDHVERPGEN